MSLVANRIDRFVPQDGQSFAGAGERPRRQMVLALAGMESRGDLGQLQHRIVGCRTRQASRVESLRFRQRPIDQIRPVGVESLPGQAQPGLDGALARPVAVVQVAGRQA